MDIKCATCQEPWEHHHLLRELPWEIWDGDEGSEYYEMIKAFLESDKTEIPDEMRAALEDEGWKFGRTIVCVLECACCASNAGEGEPKDAVKIRKDLRTEAEELLGSDLDGIISALSSIDMYARGIA